MGQVTPNIPNANLGPLMYNKQPSSIITPSVNYTLPQHQSRLNTPNIQSSNPSQVLMAAPLSSSQIQSQPVQPLIYPAPISSQKNIPITNTQPKILEISSQILITPELGTTGSSMKRPNQVIRQKHVTFESGLEELLSIREYLRSTKLYFSKIYPIMQQQLNKIQTAVENEIKAGIPDRSKLIYHLAQEKNYRLIFLKITEFRQKITYSVDMLRKKNNVSKQEFMTIISIANEASGFAKKLVTQLPTTGWNAILTNNNANLYNKIVTEAQKDPEIIQTFTTLASNVRNPNFNYAKPKEEQNLYQSRTFSIIEGPNPQESIQRPSTPRPNTPARQNSLVS